MPLAATFKAAATAVVVPEVVGKVVAYGAATATTGVADELTEVEPPVSVAVSVTIKVDPASPGGIV